MRLSSANGLKLPLIREVPTCKIYALLGRAFASALPGASESAQMVLSVVVVGKPRFWSIAESARVRLRNQVDFNV